MHPVTQEDSQLLKVEGLARLLQVSERTVRRLVKEADFPQPLRIRSCIRWRREEVLMYLRKLTEGSGPVSNERIEAVDKHKTVRKQCAAIPCDMDSLNPYTRSK